MNPPSNNAEMVKGRMLDQTGLMASTRGGGLSIHPTAIDQQCVGWVRCVNPPPNNAEKAKNRMIDRTGLMASTRAGGLSIHSTAIDQQCVGWVRCVNPPSNNAEMVIIRMIDLWHRLVTVGFQPTHRPSTNNHLTTTL